MVLVISVTTKEVNLAYGCNRKIKGMCIIFDSIDVDGQRTVTGGLTLGVV